MSSNPSGTFVPYSFGGLIPEYLYQSSSQSSLTVDSLVIGQTAIKWKLEVDLADNNKLKVYYSDDNGVTWTPKVEIAHS